MMRSRLTQSHLNLFTTCPRKYQHIFLDQLTSPVSPYQQDRLEWGTQFHLLMQQHELGLPLPPLVGEESQFSDSLLALLTATPDRLTPQPGTWREAEHQRTVSWNNYLLTVIYDLLIASPDQAEILDWKTYLRPEKRQKLQNNWQTRLYLWVLAKTSNYLPEQLSMTYWFVQGKKEPQSVNFQYDREQHQQTQGELDELLTNLSQAGEQYQKNGIPFPQVSASQGICQSCPFASRCGRLNKRKDSQNFETQLGSLANIREIPL